MDILKSSGVCSSLEFVSLCRFTCLPLLLVELFLLSSTWFAMMTRRVLVVLEEALGREVVDCGGIYDPPSLDLCE